MADPTQAVGSSASARWLVCRPRAAPDDRGRDDSRVLGGRGRAWRGSPGTCSRRFPTATRCAASATWRRPRRCSTARTAPSSPSSPNSASRSRWRRCRPLLVKAIISIEDQRFYDHQGVDTVRIAAAALTNLREGRRAQGRQHAHPAAGAPGVPDAGQVVRPQAQGSDRRRRARGRVLERRDPRAVPEQGLLRRRPARGRSRGAGVLRQARRRSHAGRGGAHRGPGEVAVRLCARR